MQPQFFVKKDELKKISKINKKSCWQVCFVVVLLTSTLTRGAKGEPSGSAKGPWKLNNDESKEPDKIQKSFICTRYEKVSKQ